jgi:hypothetical protein
VELLQLLLFGERLHALYAGDRREQAMKRWLVLAVVAAVTAFATVAVVPAQGALRVQQAAAKTCHSGYTLANFPWGVRCIRSGQYCKKVRNPEYHKYGFQCVNGKLMKLPGKKKGK